MHRLFMISSYATILFESLVVFLTGCAPISIPMHQPDPFPSNLETFLDEPWVSRKSVHDWLGEPSTTRSLGQVEIFATQLESAREYPRLSDADNTYHYHYLLIEYDANDQVQQHDLVVDAGCTETGFCIHDRRCLGFIYCPEQITAMYRYPHTIKATAQQLLAVKIERLVVYARPEVDEWVKDSPPKEGQCRIYVLRDDAPPLVRVRVPDTMPQLLPAQGYLSWETGPGEYIINVDWTDWKQNYQTRPTGVACTPGESTYLLISLHPVKKWGWRYDLTIQTLTPSIGMENLREKWLVLQ